MDFKDLTLNNIGDVKDEELVNTLFDSMMQMKKIEFIKEAKHELSVDMGEPNFELIKPFLNYKDENEERWRITVPFVNEEEREYYKKTISLELDKYYLIPESGGFVRCDSRLIEKPLGLVEIQHSGDFVFRMAKNHSFQDTKRIYSHRYYFYYDYDEERYVQVETEGLEKAKYDEEKKGKKFEIKSEKDECIKRFLDREKIVNAGKSKLKKISENREYHRKYIEFLSDTFNKGKIIDVSGNEKFIDHLSIVNITGFLERYKEYLEDEFRGWAKIKFLLEQINRREFEVFEEETQRLFQVRQDIFIEIETLFGHLNGPAMERATADLDKDNFVHIEEIRDKILKLLKEFTKFKSLKPTKVPDEKNEELLLQGFIYDRVENKLYPNASEVERRRLMTTDFSSDVDYQNYQNNVLKRLRVLE